MTPATGRLLCVLPVLDERIADQCVASILREDSAAGLRPDEFLIVDNSRDGFGKKYEANGFRVWRHPDGHNTGTSRAWNLGVSEVLHKGYDYLLIMSASMMFGPELHTTWKRQMLEFWGAKVIESTGNSWHLIALHRTCFEKIGLFDTNYFCYDEATDWCTRLRLVGWENGFIHAWSNCMSTGVAQHLQFVHLPNEGQQRYYRDKWGNDKGHEVWMLPFGTKPIDYFEDVPIPVLAERYGWGERFDKWW